MQWLYEAKKRYRLTILNYTVNSNYIHLLVFDTESQENIPRSLQLVAERTAQEYNQRKKRKGAFWEDRYHATIIEDGEHLLHYIVYIDMNMVRAGVVDHPTQWVHGGYNDIQSPRRKCILIDNNALSQLAGIDNFARFQDAHRQWVDTALYQKNLLRDTKWTQSIAVGGETFVTAVKKKMRSLSIGRRGRLSKDGCELREAVGGYNGHLQAQKCDIDANNTYDLKII